MTENTNTCRFVVPARQATRSRARQAIVMHAPRSLGASHSGWDWKMKLGFAGLVFLGALAKVSQAIEPSFSGCGEHDGATVRFVCTPYPGDTLCHGKGEGDFPATAEKALVNTGMSKRDCADVGTLAAFYSCFIQNGGSADNPVSANLVFYDNPADKTNRAAFEDVFVNNTLAPLGLSCSSSSMLSNTWLYSIIAACITAIVCGCAALCMPASMKAALRHKVAIGFGRRAAGVDGDAGAPLMGARVAGADGDVRIPLMRVDATVIDRDDSDSASDSDGGASYYSARSSVSAIPV